MADDSGHSVLVTLWGDRARLDSREFAGSPVVSARCGVFRQSASVELAVGCGIFAPRSCFGAPVLYVWRALCPATPTTAEGVGCRACQMDSISNSAAEALQSRTRSIFCANAAMHLASFCAHGYQKTQRRPSDMEDCRQAVSRVSVAASPLDSRSPGRCRTKLCSCRTPESSGFCSKSAGSPASPTAPARSKAGAFAEHNLLERRKNKECELPVLS